MVGGKAAAKWTWDHSAEPCGQKRKKRGHAGGLPELWYFFLVPTVDPPVPIGPVQEQLGL